MSIPKRALDRVREGLKKYLPILEAQRARDVSEADTVTLVKDVLSEVFGFDKYSELTSEHAIRGTFCDLAVTLDGKLRLLLEVKAIGGDLVERHTKQSIDYAANEGVEWVVLTNGLQWVLYQVRFQKPIDRDEVARLSLADLDLKDEATQERVFLFTREGISRDALDDFRARQEATNKYALAAILLNCDQIHATIRREVKSVASVKIDKEQVVELLREHVIKREAIEGDYADTATRRYLRKCKAKEAESAQEPVAEPAPAQAAPAPPSSSTADTA